MEYPQDLIERVRKEYPEHKDLYDKAKGGVPWLLRGLSELCNIEIRPDRIIALLNEGDAGILKLRQEAEQKIRREKLTEDFRTFLMKKEAAAA